MKFEIKSRWDSSKVLFTAELDAKFDDKSYGIQLGAAVKLSVKASANLAGAYLADAYLADANLTDAYLADAYLAGANLTDAYLADANLTDAYLACANLARANLTDANLAYANLARANLAYANLARANLAYANLAGAYLTGANLTGAYLADAYLADAKNVGDFTMADGLKFSEYLRDVVPALLTAGGKTIKEIVETGAWDCHSWDNCPMHAAFGISKAEDGPPLLRARIKEFITFFDGGLIPKPEIAE